MECQRHNNCGGYCETPEEIEHALCEHCLGAEREADADAAELQQLRKAMRELAGYFRSANSIPVERATIRADDFWRITGMKP